MGAEERAEAALREEVTELQAKLEAAYKGAKQELALAKDKLSAACVVGYGEIVYRHFVLSMLMDVEADIAIVVHAAWKLNPPVMPSMSSTSPAKCSPGHSLLSIVLNSISRNRTPPQVTNSSLFMLLPTTAKSAAVSASASWLSVAPDTPAH